MEAIAKTPRDRFMAKLTGKTFDSTLGVWAYSWTKRTCNADGLRIDHPDGVTGDADFMPAYAFGDGQVVGDGVFPVDVMLRRRLHVNGKGPVYEFPWYCACEEGTSGSGGEAVSTLCCGSVPRDLYITVSAPGYPTIDGTVIPLTYNSSGSGSWRSGVGFGNFFPSAEHAELHYFELTCATVGPSSFWRLQVDIDDTTLPGAWLSINNGTTGDPGGITQLPDSETCDPMSATFTGGNSGTIYWAVWLDVFTISIYEVDLFITE